MTKQLAALFVMILCVGATAYTMEGLQAEIPFDFTVGDQTFSAGTYIFEQGGKTDSGVVRVYSSDDMEAIYLLTNKTERSGLYSQKANTPPGTRNSGNSPQNADLVKSSQDTKSMEFCLVFNKYGTQYFLSKMWIGTKGRLFHQSSAEKEAIAANTTHKPETIVTAALVR